MTTPLIPQAFWFRAAVACPRIVAIPRDRGRLLDLPTAAALPDLAGLGGVPSWASARSAWNDAGLGLAIEVSGKVGPISPEPSRPSGVDTVQVWVDTRDTRTIHRATRFCHRFAAQVVPKPGRALGVDLAQRPIARAIADAPTVDLDLIRAQAERTVDGYRLELFLPAAVLHGFDPEVNRRLGLSFQVSDPDRGDQFLGVGREFPIGEDPSLWATLELVD